MDSDGSNVEPMGSTNTSNSDPAWSPDGAWIAFSCHSEAVERICIMGTAERVVAVLTAGADGWHSKPTWAPDSSRLAFRSIRGGVAYIMVVNNDGTDISYLGLKGAPSSWVR